MVLNFIANGINVELWHLHNYVNTYDTYLHQVQVGTACIEPFFYTRLDLNEAV